MAKEKDLINKSTEPHILPCKMTAKEKAKAAEQLANAVKTIENVEMDKKAIVGEFNSKIKALKKQIHDLSERVNEGIERRPVTCELQLNRTALKATLVRTDTGEIVEERPMSQEEKQMNMDYEDK